MISKLKQWLHERRESVSVTEAIQIINERHPFYLHRIEGPALIKRCKGLGDLVELRQRYIYGKIPILHNCLFIENLCFAESLGRRVPKRFLPKP